MSRLQPLLSVLLALLPVVLAAQEALPSAQPFASITENAAPGLGSRNQVALDVGILSGGLSYTRRIGVTPFSLGAGVWGAWEPPSSFDRNVWEPLGLVAFGRYQPMAWLHTDVGLTGARYLWADDCSECSGTFVGVRSAALVGYRMLFLGPEVSAGRASDERNGSEFGVIWGVQARLVFGWDGKS